MRLKIYNCLVNRIQGIQFRYHRFHDNAPKGLRIFSYLYLLWLNLCYYCFFCRFLKKRPDMVEYYEEKRIPVKNSESQLYKQEHPNLSVEAFVKKLLEYDVISFDVFDTLIFRPFALPTDVFYLIGEQMEIIDFRNIRSRAEWDVRERCKEQNGHSEISLQNIWKKLEKDLGCNAEKGMKTEMETELTLCYANPFMLQVWKELRAMGKRIIIISDMYLPKSCITKMIESAGFKGAEKVYVSCEYQKNKASGSLYKLVQKELDDDDSSHLRIIHVGDNPRSDDVMARRASWDTLPYQNVNKYITSYRPSDMSYLIGSAYRALVSNHLYNGSADYRMEYEYGFIYGGLFAVGYCSFIHEYCCEHDVDRILFLSRDGDILKQIYDQLYPQDDSLYVYWSRQASTKLMADHDKHDFFRRFVHHKVNQGYTIMDVLRGMELEHLKESLQQSKVVFHNLKPDDELTDKNVEILYHFVEANWDQVQEVYCRQQKAAQMYYHDKLSGCSKAVAVDIGWAGSGALALSYLTKHVWNIPCDITGIIAGTNTPYNAEPDATEPFLQSGKLVAYLYSQSHNRDLLKKHDPNKDYNVFWELLLSSPTPKFEGFYLTKAEAEGNQKSKKDRSVQSRKLKKDGTVYLRFGKYDANLDGIRDIQQGIRDFAEQYLEHFKEYPYMLNISGRDAYAPMLLAASHHEKYLKAIEKKFDLEINVN